MTAPENAPKTASRSQRFTGHDNIDIVADVGGPDDGLPIILLHGGGQTRHSWKKLALTLIGSGFRVTNVDLRGHGDSDWADDGNYGIDAFVSDLKILIAHQASPPMLVGASLGGITSLLAAGESDGPIVCGIALVDIVPKFDLDGSDAIARFMQSNPNGFASLDEAAEAVAAYLPHRPRPSSNAGLMKNLRPGKDGRLYWHWDPKMMDVTGDQRPDMVSERMEQAARRLRVPTLLVRGGNSDLVTLDGVKHFLDLVPDASFVDVQGAAHMVAGDMNDVFSQAIIDFIKDRLPR